MRPRVLVPALAVSLLAVTSVFLVWRHGRSPDKHSPAEPAISTTAQSSAQDTNREARIAQRVAELQDLGLEDDPASLNKILADLGNPEPEIRQAAVDAAVQFGSRDAIPKLQAAAARATNREEKRKLLDAAEFLKLPSLTEVLNRTNSAAANARRTGK